MSGASEAFDQGVIMDTALHGGFNDTNGGLVRPWRPEISLVWFGVVSATSEASNQGVMGVYGRPFKGTQD